MALLIWMHSYAPQFICVGVDCGTGDVINVGLSGAYLDALVSTSIHVLQRIWIEVDMNTSK